MPWDTVDEAEAKQITEDNPYYCPVCHADDCVPPSGDIYSDVLFIGDSPGDEEIAHGKPFVGPTGRLLKEELRKIELPLSNFRLCNMWQHLPRKITKKDESGKGCFDYGIKVVLKEALDKRLIVLVGSDTVKFFTGENVSEWNGLLVRSVILGKQAKIMAMVQPATAFHGGVGEIRFALRRFKHFLEEK